eukprot:824149-Pelagomonas_calceolata.AAC.3
MADKSIVPHKKPAAKVDNTTRRTWDKDAFREKAEERNRKVRSCVGRGGAKAMGRAASTLYTCTSAHSVYSCGTCKRGLEPRYTKEAEKDGESALDIRKRKRLERDPLHQGLIVERSHLKGREYQIDLAARLGKTQGPHGLRVSDAPCPLGVSRASKGRWPDRAPLCASNSFFVSPGCCDWGYFAAHEAARGQGSRSNQQNRLEC